MACKGEVMANSRLIEQFHLCLRVPRGLGEAECAAIRRTLDSRRFQIHLLRTVRAVTRRHRSLRLVRFTLTR